MNDYKKIDTQRDIDVFMEQLNGFHDSIIKEVNYVSGSKILKNKQMQPVNVLRELTVIFYSLNTDFPVIEMKFSKIQKLNLVPRTEQYDSIILGASLCLIDNLFYWSEWTRFKLEDIGKFDKTWVSSEKVYWRPLKSEDVNL